MGKKRIIVGISGASGFRYGIETLRILSKYDIETHLVVTRGAEATCQLETTWKKEDLLAYVDEYHCITDLSASIASGSFKTLGMIIAPCSMSSLASIANGLTNNLLTRAADVVLKERRRLVLIARETPLSMVHLRNMQYVTEMGGIIYPPVPGLYQNPRTVDDIIYNSIARSLDLFGLDVSNIKRWGES
jgi:4-hydroxy-3-polyprenylbenzoate decarboxylase